MHVSSHEDGQPNIQGGLQQMSSEDREGFMCAVVAVMFGVCTLVIVL
jgi:hypothetical protein